LDSLENIGLPNDNEDISDEDLELLVKAKMEQTDQDVKLASKLDVQKADYQLPSYKIGLAL